MILTKRDIYILYALLAVVYVFGLFIPIMENDSAQHATMAMRMFLKNDFLNIYVGTKDYLDKPHMHFWLAALSFKLFGISHWAYRLPAIFFTLIGAFYSNRLAVHFYGRKVKHMASLAFLSSQAIILANHDVRTDAVLTGATILAIYHFVKYLDRGRVKSIVLGFLGLAIGFSSKGELAVFVVGVCLLIHVLYTRKWSFVFSYKMLIGLFAYAVFISPVLYAYYVQYDLHPEKVFHGVNNVSGVRFILWDQSFNRLTASGFSNNSPDYLFFFHSILWAFLPWPLIMYAAMFTNIKRVITSKFKTIKSFELMTSLGVFLVLLVISTSKFKLPHYLNSLFPLMSVLVVGYLWHLQKTQKHKILKRWANFQIGLFIFLSAFVIYLSFWAFAISSIWVVALLVVCVLLLILFLVKEKPTPFRKLIVSSVGFMIVINLCMNAQFYPNLLQYQSGIPASEIISKHGNVTDKVYLMKDVKSWSLNLYRNDILKELSLDKVDETLASGDWMYLNEGGYRHLKATGVKWSEEYSFDHYRITMLKWSFLNPTTRESTLIKTYLIKK